MVTNGIHEDEELRRRAMIRLKKRRDLYGHALIFVLVNAAAIVIWTMGDGGFFWPIFLILGWGIGLIMNAWDVFYRNDQDEATIQREMERLRRHAT